MRKDAQCALPARGAQLVHNMSMHAFPRLLRTLHATDAAGPCPSRHGSPSEASEALYSATHVLGLTEISSLEEPGAPQPSSCDVEASLMWHFFMETDLSRHQV